ncbi:hypothetical protein CBOM_05717 [Ceraceosorus bombacis]|uniref:Uncharacterized protein n=1 Tax=Ceraceosorus bombacis TaxID=401625 RepID=A0A0P1BPY3_9BASI|nr:hypothetical protein CBOM_05717 [Ceraceosorus bombacis]
MDKTQTEPEEKPFTAFKTLVERGETSKNLLPEWMYNFLMDSIAKCRKHYVALSNRHENEVSKRSKEKTAEHARYESVIDTYHGLFRFFDISIPDGAGYASVERRGQYLDLLNTHLTAWTANQRVYRLNQVLQEDSGVAGPSTSQPGPTGPSLAQPTVPPYDAFPEQGETRIVGGTGGNASQNSTSNQTVYHGLVQPVSYTYNISYGGSRASTPNPPSSDAWLSDHLGQLNLQASKVSP